MVEHLVDTVIHLQRALDRPPRSSSAWRHLVKRELTEVATALAAERDEAEGTWLSARSLRLARERECLVERVSALGALVEGAETAQVRAQLRRTLTDIRHHHQRMNDLRFDSVAMEVGGSE